MGATQRELLAAAKKLASLLRERDLQIVFAESCTAGLVSATLATVPGVSAHLCGSAVVYQVKTKSEWLGIPENLLADPGPVSSEVAIEMATRVLAKTPQANVAVSVTGHLGPNAPAGQDGLIYVAAAHRDPRGEPATLHTRVREHCLGRGRKVRGRSETSRQLRIRRQATAALRTLEMAIEIVSG